MDPFHILLMLVIVVLLVDRHISQDRSARQLDRMNKALIARTVPEYEYNNRDEIKKVKLENDLAVTAHKLIDEDDRGIHVPIT